MELIDHFLEDVAHYVDLFGILIILYGFVISGIGFVRAEVKRLKDPGNLVVCHSIRIQLGSYILTGIEFMIASDIIHTVLTRELTDLVFVAVLVVIRTAISFFLGREIKELANEPLNLSPKEKNIEKQ